MFLAGTFKDRDTVAALLKAAGARILSRPPVPSSMDKSDSRLTAASRTSIVLCEACPNKQKIAGMPHISITWLLDSASVFDVQPLANYSVWQPCTRKSLGM